MMLFKLWGPKENELVCCASELFPRCVVQRHGPRGPIISEGPGVPLFWSQKVTLLASSLMCRSLRVAASHICEPIIVDNTAAATTHHSIGLLAAFAISVSAAEDPHPGGEGRVCLFAATFGRFPMPAGIGSSRYPNVPAQAAADKMVCTTLADDPFCIFDMNWTSKACVVVQWGLA